MELKEIKPEYEDTKLKEPTNIQDVLGRFRTVSTAPSKAPKNWYEQIQIYINGATYRLYIYDTVGNVWHYVALT